MNNEQQKGQFEKDKVPPSMPEDKKEFKKDVKQKDIEADDDTGEACADKGGSCGTSSDDRE